MNTRMIALTAALAALIFANPAQAPSAQDAPAEHKWDGKTLAIHEWGTFTSVQGSDGVVLDGLRHHEKDLPDFVYDLTDFANVTGVSPKMETPVIYFYSPKAARASVEVKMPRGVLTQWYPAASFANHGGMMVNGAPEPASGREITQLKDGYLRWGFMNDLRVLAPGATDDVVASDAKGGTDKTNALLPAVAKDDPWRFCREVDANTLRACSLNAARKADANGAAQRVVNEYEKCLFYRGLGNFALPLDIKVDAEHVGNATARLTLRLKNSNPGQTLKHLLFVHNQGGIMSWAYQPELREGAHELSFTAKDRETALHEMGEVLVKALVAEGLFTKEARAMVNTWEHGYFREEGLRVLYVLPTELIDRELPLSISMDSKRVDPAAIKRVFVARTDVITPSREKHLDGVVAAVATGDETARKAGLEEIDRWGRFATPFLQRVIRRTNNEAVKAEAEKRLEAMKVRR